MTQNSSTAYVLYDNLFLRGTVTASSVAAGSHALHAVDWRTTTFWTASTAATAQTYTVDLTLSMPADSVALYRHNLGIAGATVAVQSWSGSAWVTQLTLSGLTDNQCIYRRFNQVSATKWRLLITSSIPVFIGVIMLGLSLHLPYGMPVGFVPPRHNRQTDIVSTKTEAGQFVGQTVIKRGSESELTLQRVRPDWLRAYGEPFIQHAEKYPFIFSWKYVDYPEDAVFCRCTKSIPAMPYQDHGWQSLRIPIECLP